MCALPSVFFAADASALASSLAARGHSVTSVESPRDLLGTLNAPAAPELIVLSAPALLGSGLGVLAALKSALSGSGATVLLVSDLSAPLTLCAAHAVGAHAAVLGPLEGAPFAHLAERLLGERTTTRAAAAELRIGAAPRRFLR